MGIENVRGKLNFLRVNRRGGAFGPPGDSLDAEVIAKFIGRPNEAFGLQLRNGADLAANEGMASLLREAFVSGATVNMDFDRVGARRNNFAVLVELVKP
jgi:hypothetical protein